MGCSLLGVAVSCAHSYRGGWVESGGVLEGREFGEPLLTVGEVAQLMRVSNMTVYRLIKSGQLSAIRVGKNYRIRRSDIERYLTERAVNAPVEPS